LSGAKKDTRRFFSHVTLQVQKYEQKYCNPVTLREYSKIIVSGNRGAASLYVSAEDRRILEIEVSPVLKGNTKFWDAVGVEVLDKQIMKSWFDFFSTRDLSKFDFRVPPEVFVVSKQKLVLQQRKKSHVFLQRMMTTPNFLSEYQFYTDNIIDVERIAVKPKERRGQVRIRIEQGVFYKAYCFYIDKYHPGAKKVYFPTFLKEVEELGVVVCDKSVRIRRDKDKQNPYKVVDLWWEDYLSAFKTLYKCDPPELWITEDEKGLQRLYDFLGKTM
jgi:hypothetical protein